jgi:hypothetical protein
VQQDQQELQRHACFPQFSGNLFHPLSLLRQDERVDEEICPGYDSKRFYPAKPGEILANRYQILVKVGWGVSSTVWLYHLSTIIY